MIPAKRFDNFFPSGECSEGLDAIRFSFKHDKRSVAIQLEMPCEVCSCWTSIALAKGAYWWIVISDPLGLATDSGNVFFFIILPYQ